MTNSISDQDFAHVYLRKVARTLTPISASWEPCAIHLCTDWRLSLKWPHWHMSHCSALNHRIKRSFNAQQPDMCQSISSNFKSVNPYIDVWQQGFMMSILVSSSPDKGLLFEVETSVRKLDLKLSWSVLDGQSKILNVSKCGSRILPNEGTELDS